MTRRTRLVIVSHITFSTGTLLPIHEIVEKCHKVSKSMGQRVFILIDGAHAVGNIKVNIKDVGCDFYAFDGHKWLLGPEGTGILYSKEQYLKPNNAFGVNFLFSTAFMVSPKYAPKKSDGREYELGTADATKIIGLGAAIESRSKLNQREISSWKKHLVQRFLKSLEGTRWKILNSNEANRTAIVCLQIAGDHQNSKTYETVVNQLDKLNIHVRSVEKPPCVRLCFNHYNNEMDVEIAAFHLKALLEGIDVHRGNDEKIKKKIKELIQKTLAPDEKSDLSGKIGLSLFSIPGSGKTTAVSEAIEELYRSGIIKGKIISRAKDILKNPTKEFSSIFDEAWKKENHPAVIFLDEADSLFDARQKAILGIFNDEQTRILKERKKGRMPIVFITAENDPKAIFESVARRLRLIYFPLPDFKTRLKLLNKLARTAKCSSKLLLTQIANLTDGYSMSDLKELWKEIIGEAGGDPITPDHLHAALQKFRAEALDASLLSKYAQFINDLNPILLTGALEEF